MRHTQFVLHVHYVIIFFLMFSNNCLISIQKEEKNWAKEIFSSRLMCDCMINWAEVRFTNTILDYIFFSFQTYTYTYSQTSGKYICVRRTKTDNIHFNNIERYTSFHFSSSTLWQYSSMWNKMLLKCMFGLRLCLLNSLRTLLSRLTQNKQRDLTQIRLAFLFRVYTHTYVYKICIPCIAVSHSILNMSLIWHFGPFLSAICI